MWNVALRTLNDFLSLQAKELGILGTIWAQFPQIVLMLQIN